MEPPSGPGSTARRSGSPIRSHALAPACLRQCNDGQFRCDLHGLRPRVPRVLKSPMRSLGRLTLEAHYHRMMRVCWFSVLVACLAAMAAIGPPALARTAAGSDTQIGSVVAAAPLTSHHRHDCGQAPCALMAGYTSACQASAPILSAPAIDLPSPAAEHRYWPLGLAELAGQRPLPNPLPPKR